MHLITGEGGLPRGFAYPELNLLEATIQIKFALSHQDLISTENMNFYYEESTKYIRVVFKLVGEELIYKMLFPDTKKKYKKCLYALSECIFIRELDLKIQKLSPLYLNGKTIKLPRNKMLYEIRVSNLGSIFKKDISDFKPFQSFMKKYIEANGIDITKFE